MDSLATMKFLTNWTIDLQKLPKYAAFKGDFVLDLDYKLLQLCYDSAEPVFTDDRKASLAPILKRFDKAKNTLTVRHSQNYEVGRFYAAKSISPICVSRVIKHTLFKYLDWIDLDMVKGHPSILCSVARLNNYLTPAFDKYLADPEGIFKQLIEHYSIDEIVTEDEVKNIFNISIYGGSHDAWIYQMNKAGKIVKKTPHPFVVKFITEARGLIDTVYSQNKALVDLVKGESADEHKVKNRVMSYWCGAIENEIIHSCYKFLLKKGVIEERKVALEYDGICFKKPAGFNEDVSDEIITTLNAFIKKQTGMSVKMKFKGYKDEHVSLSIIELRKEARDLPTETPQQEEKQAHCEEESEGEGCEGVDDFSNFAGMAKVFEENHAKIINKGMFVKRTSNDVIVMSKTQLITAYENLWYWGLDKYFEKEQKTFINEWLRNNTDQRAYDDFGCYPHDQVCPERIFNVWTPFAMENITEFEEKPDELKRILKHILILCNNDVKIYDYFILWIAQMIRCPSRKSNMPVFISDEGSGKGTIMRLLELMMGHNKVMETTKPSRDVWGMFNGQMANCFLVILNEIGKKECAESDGEIKGLITDPTLTINNKGVGQYKIQSYHRFITTTNKPEPMGTTDGDRRKWFIKCSDELKGNDSYFVSFYKMLEDENVVKTCYEYFKGLEAADEFHLLKMPKTEYAEDLCSLSKSPIEQFLGDYVLGIDLKNGVYTKDVLSAVLFDDFKRWKEDNDIKFDVNNISFTLKLKHLNINGITKQIMAKGYKGYEIDVELVKKHLGVGLALETRKTPAYLKELMRLHREAKREEKQESARLMIERQHKKLDGFLTSA